jgi:hypothetical protein
MEREPQWGSAMTHRNVETMIGRLATDAALRRRFKDDKEGVLREFREQGHELTPVELEALASTSDEALRSLGEALDVRIRRLDSGSDTQGK